jgi:protein-disulfide isomerase
MAGDHYRGNLDAPLVVIEFSDFECPFCREHALGSQPLIDEALVDTGEVLWVFKHLPLEIHPGALSAAVAAECAADQGLFWEMHDLLFASAARWAGEGVDTDAELILLADELGLSRAVFSACFDGRDALQRVLADITDATGIISSTPSFVVIQDGRGSLLQGALPPDQFIEALRTRLDEGA